MVEVSFTSSLQASVDGAASLDIEARTFRELLKTLVSRYPDFQHQIDIGIALAINGEIYRDNLDVEIPPDAEVFLLPRIPGG